jgi:sodium/proline symporter
MDAATTAIILTTFSAVIGIFILVAHFAAKKGDNSAEEFIIGSRQFGKTLIGLSVFASAGSGFMVIGAVGAGYSIGLSALWAPLAFMLGEYVFWTYFPHRINRVAHARGAETVPHHIALASDNKRSVRFVAGLIISILITIYLSAQFVSAGKIVNAVLGYNQTIGIVLMAIIVCAYCVRGGLPASMWNEAIQGLMELTLCIGMVIYVLAFLGGPVQAYEILATTRPDLADPMGIYTGWTLLLFIAGFAATGFGFGLGSPQGLTRIVAGKDETAARHAKWIYLGCAYTQWFGMTIFGVFAALIIPSLSDPEQALAAIAARDFPPILIGLVLAGMFAAIASAADSQLLVTATAVSEDLTDSSQKSEKERKRRLTFALIGVTLVAILLADSAGTFNVFQMVIFVNAAAACAIAPAVLVATLGWRTSATALIGCMLSGAVTSVLWNVAGLSKYVNEALIGFIIALVAHWIIASQIKDLHITPNQKAN